MMGSTDETSEIETDQTSVHSVALTEHTATIRYVALSPNGLLSTRDCME